MSAIADFGCVIMNKKKVIGFERETTFKKNYYKKKKIYWAGKLWNLFYEQKNF